MDSSFNEFEESSSTSQKYRLSEITGIQENSSNHINLWADFDENIINTRFMTLKIIKNVMFVIYLL